MADISPVIETLEHRWMRAWISRDVRTLKGMTSPKFRFVLGSKPAVILDCKSWLEAANTRYHCKSYRFGDIYARDLGCVAVFGTQLEIQAIIDGRDWSGPFWLSALWGKTRVRRRWRIVERTLSRLEETPEVPSAVRSLQLWR